MALEMIAMIVIVDLKVDDDILLERKNENKKYNNAISSICLSLNA